MLKQLRSLFQAAAGRHGFEKNMADELKFHVDQYVVDLVRSGVPAQEAQRRARIEFGSFDNVREDCRQARGLRLLDITWRTSRHALRALRHSPGFALAALIPLALCIGVNLTIFAVIDSVLLRPLPFPDADRLVTMYNTYPQAHVDRDGSSYTNYYERRGNIAGISGMALFRKAQPFSVTHPPRNVCRPWKFRPASSPPSEPLPSWAVSSGTKR